MRIFKLSFLLFLVGTIRAFGQAEEIYRLTFSDPTNFDIMNSLSHKQPKTILISNATDSWDYTVFWNGFVGGETQDQIDQETKTSRHESYDPEYLFRDPQMLKAVNAAERKSLRKRTLIPSARKISLKGLKYHTITSIKSVKGFCVSTTEPIFTSDDRYAFIKVAIYFGGHYQIDGAWYGDFGSVTLVYEKQPNGKWKKYKKFDHLIL